ncbi:MAG: hypothetical protein JWO48_838 [Bryobacterales bacterium]|nr:hypothetical protein [Bryobacterales bacterium]
MPLQLWNQPHWELKGRADSGLFFRHLWAALPAATTLFVEGTSLTQDVEDFLRSATEPGDYLPDRQTLWPRPKHYRVRCDRPTLAALADLAQRHAEPELLDHLSVYDGSRVLLEFPDAFMRDSVALISADTDEQRIRGFAAMLGLEVLRAEPV